MAGAYYEKMARINLTTGEIKVERLDPALAHGFIGGRGPGVKLLYDEGVATADPLSSENKFLCVTGPMTGAVAPSSGRYAVITKSPVTGKIVSSNSGGIWGAKLKFAGWDALIIEGEAREWTYISIEDSIIRLHDAHDYVGVMTTELDRMLKGRHGKDSSVLSIGPAGEKRVLLAAIMNDAIRAAGRGGIGAVMGSKKLKAIVVRTSRTHLDTISDPEALKIATNRALSSIKENSASGIGLHRLETNTVDGIVNCVGSLPGSNWYLSNSVAEEEFFDENQLVKSGGCYRCPIACSRAGKNNQHQSGNNMNLFDQCSMLCNEYGLDTIGLQRSIAAAVELYQRGAIKENECTGIPIDWGSIVEWTKRIGNPKKKLDWLMSSGAEYLCQQYGMPEISRNRGGMTMRREEVSGVQRSNCNEKDEKYFRALTSVIDSMGQCLFTSQMLGLREYTDLLNATVGTNWTVEQVLEIGEHIYNTECTFNKMSGMKSFCVSIDGVI